MVFRATSVACVSLLLLAALPLFAQESPSSPPPANLPTETLHVYTNRMQFPTLLINNEERAIENVPLNKFNITLDSGKSFHPSSIHMEGDDPLSIAVLLDLSGGEKQMLKELPDALAKLIPNSLNPQDHLYFYALDCKIIGLPSPVDSNAEAIQSSLAAITAAPVRRKNNTRDCVHSLRLWDAVTTISQDLSHAYGRHVLLVVSNGSDRGSLITLPKMAEDVSANSVAVFGVRDLVEAYARRGPVPAMADLSRQSQRPMLTLDEEDPFLELCTRSGGFILNVLPGTLSDRLRNLVALLRSRYVLEFARPDDNWAGWHNMAVKAAGARFALPTGASAPLADPSVLKAPDVVPTQPSPAVIGDRRKLEPKSP